MYLNFCVDIYIPRYVFIYTYTFTINIQQVVMGIGSGTLGVTRAWVAEQTERSKR